MLVGFLTSVKKGKRGRRRPVEGGHWMHRKCELVTQELSGGSRSGVEGEQKLCKPHTERERGPPDALADAKSVCLHLFSVRPHLWFVLSDSVSLHLFVRSKTIFISSSIYTKKASSLFGPLTQHIVYDSGLFRTVSGEGGRTIQTPAARTAQTAFKSFHCTGPVISLLLWLYRIKGGL